MCLKITRTPQLEDNRFQFQVIPVVLFSLHDFNPKTENLKSLTSPFIKFSQNLGYPPFLILVPEARVWSQLYDRYDELPILKSSTKIRITGGYILLLKIFRQHYKRFFIMYVPRTYYPNLFTISSKSTIDSSHFFYYIKH